MASLSTYRGLNWLTTESLSSLLLRDSALTLADLPELQVIEDSGATCYLPPEVSKLIFGLIKSGELKSRVTLK